MPRIPTLTRVSELAQDQWGLVTRRQAEEAGVSPATLQRLADKKVLERVARGVYRLPGAPEPDHVGLRAAWLQLAADIPAWERTDTDGVISHRSAAALYGLGHLPADRHEITVPDRKQTRRQDVRLHHRQIDESEWTSLRGLPVTRPSRIAADLLAEHEDPAAVAHLIVDAIRTGYEQAGTFADALAPYASRYGLRRRDGLGLLRWLLDLVGDPETARWMEEARATHAIRPVGQESES